MDNIVKLVFQSAVAGSGFDDFLRKTEASVANSNQLGQSLTVMSSKLGTVGAAIGGVVGNLVKGSLWGAATAGIMGVVEAFKKWRAEAALAAEANAKAFKATIDEANAAAEQIKSAYQKSNERIDAEAKKKLEAIELTKRQTKAELELAAAKARAAGNESAAAEAEKKSAVASGMAARESAKVSVEAAYQKREEAKRQASGLVGWKDGEFKFDPKEWERQRRLSNGRISRLRRGIDNSGDERAKEPSWDTRNADKVLSANPEYQDENGKTIKGRKALEEELKKEQESRAKLLADMKKSKQAAENIADAERVLTAARKEEKIAIVENQKSIVIARAAAAKASKDEMLKKYQSSKSGYDTQRQSAASERDRWQGEFDRAFDLWRDPDAAASAVEADKRRGEDMKAFRKAVNRYGGKGKIDEYASLMRAGDEEGMQERLTQWRKSSKFTPQVEQMVKAAAADQNKNAAEKSLANIEKHTAELAKEFKEILAIK